MGSHIEGYNYDIFISYRQKDNKYDGWVTEFVDNLKKELEATFKEEVSVYFDINPHDGLLETHHVDESLRDKLNCLVFIPIISRTYCDPKSFAWEHEFKAFVEQTSKDKFGLKVKLPNGNVVGRVLPIQIHDLEADDKKLFESVLGVFIRGVEFVYKEPGVNRPLTPKDDERKNLNSTIYRNQINKVANAIKEIISWINPEKVITTEKQLEKGIINKDLIKSAVKSKDNQTKIFQGDPHIKKLKSLKAVIYVLTVLTVLFGVYGFYSLYINKSRIYEVEPTYSTIQVESINTDGIHPFFNISPDGRSIAYSSFNGIVLRSLSGFSEKLFEGTAGARNIVFSPDAKFIGYQKGDNIYKVGINGFPTSLIHTKFAGGGMSWASDGNIYFSPGYGDEGIWRVSSNGGEARQLTTVIDSLGETAHLWPQFLPESNVLIYVSIGPSGGSSDSRIVAQNIKTGKQLTIVEKAIAGSYLPTGAVLFANDEGSFFTIQFNPSKLRCTGEPMSVLSGINTAAWGGSAYLSVSMTGTLLYFSRNRELLSVIEVLDRNGKVVLGDSIPLKPLEKIGFSWNPCNISPDGKYLAFEVRNYGSADIWIINLATKEPERVTFSTSIDETPVWAPDGKKIAYSSSASGTIRQLLVKDLSQSGNPRLIRTWPRHIHLSDWSSDGKWFLVNDINPRTLGDCYAISVESGDSIPIAVSEYDEDGAKISPDGKWIAFTSDESGRHEIYIVSFPNIENKRQITNEGASGPRWSKNGNLIYYMTGNNLMTVEVNTETGFKKGKFYKLFSARSTYYLPTPDGNRFYFSIRNPNGSNPHLKLVTNWFKDLEKLSDK